MLVSQLTKTLHFLSASGTLPKSMQADKQWEISCLACIFLGCLRMGGFTLADGRDCVCKCTEINDKPMLFGHI